MWVRGLWSSQAVIRLLAYLEKSCIRMVGVVEWVYVIATAESIDVKGIVY